MYILNPIDIDANTNLTQEFHFGSQEHSRDKHREIFTGINVDRHGGCEKETVGAGGNTRSNSPPLEDENTSSQQDESTAAPAVGENSFRRKKISSWSVPASTQTHKRPADAGGLERISKENCRHIRRTLLHMSKFPLKAQS